MKCLLLSINNIDENYIYDILKEDITQNMKVLCIPFASDINWLGEKGHIELNVGGEFYNKHFKPFSKYGISENNFYVTKINDDEYFIKQKLIESDIIYFSGGKPENISFLLYYKNLIDHLLKVKSNKIFIGESAGSMVLQDKYTITPHVDPDYKMFCKKEGLGIIDTTDLLVHYDITNKKHRLNLKITKFFNFGKKKVIAISDHGAVYIKDNTIQMLGEVYK